MKKILKVFSIDIVSKFFAVISTFIIIRYMSTSDYANYTIIISLIAIVNGIFLSGFNRIYIVEYNRIKENQLNIFVIQLLFILIIGIIASFFLNISNILLIITLLFSTSLFHFIRTTYQQRCFFKRYAFIDLIRVLIFSVFILVMIIKTKSLPLNLTIIIQSLSLFSAIGFLIVLISKDKTIKMTKNFKSIFKILSEKEQFVLFAFFGLTAMLMQIDIMSLKKWSNDLMLASYSSALRYYSLEIMLLDTVNNIMLPEVNKENSKEKIRIIYKQHNMLAIIFAILIIVAIIVSPYIIPLIDQGKYPESINVFRVLSVSAIISFTGSPYINFLMKAKKYSFAVIINIISIILAIILNYFLIHLIGAIGAAVSSLIAYGFNNMSVKIYANYLIKRIKDED